MMLNHRSMLVVADFQTADDAKRELLDEDEERLAFESGEDDCDNRLAPCARKRTHGNNPTATDAVAPHVHRAATDDDFKVRDDPRAAAAAAATYAPRTIATRSATAVERTCSAHRRTEPARSRLSRQMSYTAALNKRIKTHLADSVRHGKISGTLEGGTFAPAAATADSLVLILRMLSATVRA